MTRHNYFSSSLRVQYKVIFLRVGITYRKEIREEGFECPNKISRYFSGMILENENLKIIFL